MHTIVCRLFLHAYPLRRDWNSQHMIGLLHQNYLLQQQLCHLSRSSQPAQHPNHPQQSNFHPLTSSLPSSAHPNHGFAFNPITPENNHRSPNSNQNHGISPISRPTLGGHAQSPSPRAYHDISVRFKDRGDKCGGPDA